MNDEYARLFNIRGQQYHAAMARFPRARDAEFATIVELAGVRPGQVVADIPCGGGYLAHHLPAGIDLYPVDSSDVFADCFRDSHQRPLLLAPITAVPLADAALDAVLSLAGLHHVEDRRPFWRECARLLKPGGILAVADVRAGSPVAQFLDGTVDRHTSTGHRGIYFGRETVAELEQAGFRVEVAEPRAIAWRADDPRQLAGFCQLLFGLENIDAAALEPILAAELGLRRDDQGAVLDWELMCYRAVRQAATA